MKVVFAMVAAWLLRAAYRFDWADRLETWAGIDYSDDDWPGSA